MSSNHSAAHTKLVDDIMFAVGSSTWARCWKHTTGVGRAYDNPERIISFGLPGSTDLVGILDDGRFLAIEVKTGSGRLSKQQRAFKAMILKFQGVYIEARSVDDALRALKPDVGSI